MEPLAVLAQIQAPALEEVSSDQLDQSIISGHPFVVRGCSIVRAAQERLSPEALKQLLQTTPISIEHKHRWESRRTTLSAREYLDNLDRTDFYWRQADLRSLGISDLKLPSPANVRSDTMFFDSLWVGPNGTVQTFHQDNHDVVVVNRNLFCQVHGSKYVAIASPADSEYFQAYPLKNGTDRHSSVSPFDPATALNCPSFAHSILQSGDLLYVPPRYWHYLQSLSISVSVSRWWFSSRLVELLYASAISGEMAEPTFLGELAWDNDVRELGGVDVLTQYIERLSGVQKYAICARLVRLYGEGIFKHGRQGKS
ncbi:hypothetical protein ACVIHH_008228 [Bradyrhizobium sp. USDA 4518]